MFATKLEAILASAAIAALTLLAMICAAMFVEVLRRFLKGELN